MCFDSKKYKDLFFIQMFSSVSWHFQEGDEKRHNFIVSEALDIVYKVCF